MLANIIPIDKVSTVQWFILKFILWSDNITFLKKANLDKGNGKKVQNKNVSLHSQQNSPNTLALSRIVFVIP